MTHPELHIVAAGEACPFDPEAVVREEDTWLVLSRPPVVEPPDADPPRLLREARDYEPRSPGSVVVREGRPVALLAVVHDLDRDPTCRPGWVDEALRAVMEELHRRGVARLALPVLGAVHGNVAPQRFLRSLAAALASDPPWALEAICLGLPADVDPRTARDLERLWSER